MVTTGFIVLQSSFFSVQPHSTYLFFAADETILAVIHEPLQAYKTQILNRDNVLAQMSIMLRWK